MRTICLAASLLLAPCLVTAQTAHTGAGGAYTFGVIAGTGQLGQVVTFENAPSSPTTHTVMWTVSGTAPSACTFSLEGSADQTTWFPISYGIPCTATGYTVPNSQAFPFVRANVLTYVLGDGTTAFTVRYVHGAL